MCAILFRSFLLFTLIFFCFRSAYALEVKDIRFGTYPDKTRIVLDIDTNTDFRTFMLMDPTRIVIDLPLSNWTGTDLKDLKTKNIQSVRSGNLDAGITRFVIDLKEPSVIDNAFFLPRSGEKMDRIVIDFRESSEENFRKKASKVFGTLDVKDIPPISKRIKEPPPEVKAPEGNRVQQFPVQISQKLHKPMPPEGQGFTRVRPVPIPERKPLRSETKEAKKSHIKKSTLKKKYHIVIDPGHGGNDPGATGHNGAYEKGIVLSLSKELKKQLESTGRYKATLTRDSDYYVKLKDRVQFARNKKADLFVSIHADSLPQSSARGASFYTLSEKASDAQTAKLAARENQSDIIAGVDLSVEDEDVANILVDLARRDTMNQSKFFANTLVEVFRKLNLKTLENPHRHAGFAVLKAPDIPSVLIEAGFISNRTEAKLLSQKEHRTNIANALKTSIESYFQTVEENNRL